MLVICEKCGKRHGVKTDLSKLEGKLVKSKCLSCGHMMTISLPDQPGQISNAAQLDENAQAGDNSRSKGRMGIRSKMLLLFFIIPVVIFAISCVLYLGQLKSLSNILNTETTGVVENISQLVISEKANAVAREVGLYLKTHPSLTEEDFGNDKEFMGVAVQKVGTTGYTVLNSGPTKAEPWRIKAHPKKALIGSDIFAAMKKRMSPEDYNVFKRLHDTAAETKALTSGYYRWLDGREKYLSMAPIQGTNYWLLSTTYLEEFTEPMIELQQRASLATAANQKIVLIILAATIILIAFVTIFYGTALSKRIKSLTDVTDRISLGDLDAEIDVTGKDELTDLAAAISRMQSSVRISLALSGNQNQ